MFGIKGKMRPAPGQATNPTPSYNAMSQKVESICYTAGAGTEWYPPVMRSADSIAQQALHADYLHAALEVLQRLEMDDYCRYLAGYYQAGIQRFGQRWQYADIVTVLLSLADCLAPKSYLEIGVRRGRSVCAVASRAPQCDIYMFDMWVANYAGMANPGAELVASELQKFGHTGRREFHNGDSHALLKPFFKARPDLAFDIITVDGDHTLAGAQEDLCDVLPHLKIGGAVVFDDVCHPKHMYLRDVWESLVVRDPRFSSWTNYELGYGIGFAIRKW